jgi:hypothetical protein
MFKKILRIFVKPPKMVSRVSKPPYASFSKLQFKLYPDICKQQFLEAISYCDAEERRKQWAMFYLYFGK